MKSVRNIEKITKVRTVVFEHVGFGTDSRQSMKVVASTKLTRAERAMREAKKYGAANNGQSGFRVKRTYKATAQSERQKC